MLNIFFVLRLFVILSFVNGVCAKRKADNEYYKFSETCMGTKFSLLIDGDDLQLSKKVARKAFKEASRLDKILSDYISESELSILSQNSGSGDFKQLSSELFEVLKNAQILAKETNGNFDVTIGSLSRLWRIARFKETLPEHNKLVNALERVGYTNLVLDHIKQKAKLLKKDMTLDLGGIAKGYAADRMLEICKLHNLPRVLIDAGGDILLGNAPRGKNGWLVEIGGRKHPDFPILTLSNTAIATSGDIEQSVTINEKTYSHLINPSTGIGLTSLAQVTVIAPTAMNADSLASACLVLGLEKSKTLLHSKKQVTAYYLIQDEGNLILSRINEDN